MYAREFENVLKQSLPNALLIYGESYLSQRVVEQYKDRLDARESHLSLYYDEYDFQQAKSYLFQSSLFGGVNLLIIKRDKKIPKKELDTLVELTKKNPDNYFIFDFRGEAKDAKSMQSSFSEKKGGIWVRFFEPNYKEALLILREVAKKNQLNIKDDALLHLFTTLKSKLSLVKKEIEKLSLLQREITPKDIDELVYSTAPLAMDNLLQELFDKKSISETISKLLETGESEYSIIRNTQFFIHQIFLFRAYIKINGYADSSAILGYKLPKNIEERRASLASKLKDTTILKIYEHLIEGELKIKRTPASTREALLFGVMRGIQSLL